jgi:hypothetical protein
MEVLLAESRTKPIVEAGCKVGTKLRWKLTADKDETDTVAEIAEGCGTTTVEYTVAP